MKRLVAPYVILLSALCSDVVHAYFVTGQDLFLWLKKLEQKQLDYEAIAGSGYVIGVADQIDELLYCAPAGKTGVTKGQITQIVYNYLEKHPEYWNLPASVSVVNALTELYPCERQQ